MPLKDFNRKYMRSRKLHTSHSLRVRQQCGSNLENSFFHQWLPVDMEAKLL